MPGAEKFIVMPFKKARAGIVPAEIRQASNAVSAERIAASMSSRFIGVVALSAVADVESGDLTGARLLASFGQIGDLSAIVEFSHEHEQEPDPVEEDKSIKEPDHVEMPVAETPKAETKPVDAARNASSLILTAPPEPTSTRRAPASNTRRRKPAAPSAGPLFDQEQHHA